MPQTTLNDTVDSYSDHGPSCEAEQEVPKTTCDGCHETMLTFSGERSFCLRCTALICRHELAPDDFMSGRLEEYATGELSSDEWSMRETP